MKKRTRIVIDASPQTCSHCGGGIPAKQPHEAVLKGNKRTLKCRACIAKEG